MVDSAFEDLITSGAFPNNSAFAQGGTLADRHLRAPYLEQGSLEIQHQFSSSLNAGIGYLFVAGNKLVRPIDLNVGPSVGTEIGTNKRIYDYAINQGGSLPWGPFGTNGIFYYTDSSGNSVYHGLLLQAQKKLGRYFSLHANYTSSKTLDDGTLVTFVSTPQSNEQCNLERALSNQDVRHRFIANFVLDAPNHGIWRNFKLSSIITVQSPRPFTEFVDANNGGPPVPNNLFGTPRTMFNPRKFQLAAKFEF